MRLFCGNIFFVFGFLAASVYAQPKAVLLTGGAGFIGSHVAVELLERDIPVVIVDDLENSKSVVLERIEAITGKQPRFYHIDVRSVEDLTQVFSENDIDAVVHLAGYKSVSESVAQPLKYYDNNLVSTISLLKVMEAFECRRLVFSSSAVVYGRPAYLPLDEQHSVSPTNPYGRTKLVIEQILEDVAKSNPEWRIIALRYFNPVGAHPSGLIGEDPQGIPNNLLPYILQVMVGRLPMLTVTGSDYETADGTGVRDYIHVVDLAKAHVAALKKTDRSERNFSVYNIGTGNGFSVLEMLRAVEGAAGQTIPYKLGNRREGDVATVFADTELARDELEWRAELGIEEMARDAVNWIQRNPMGYEK